MEIRNDLKFSQRFEFGIYQFLDHVLSRKVAFFLTGRLRRYLFRRIRKTLIKSGEGRVLSIDRHTDLSFEDFQKNYVNKGIPVIFEGMGKDWPCVKNWSLDYFKDLHGDHEIVMLNSKHIEEHYERITLADLIDDIKAGGSKYYRFYPLLTEHPEHLADFDYEWIKKHRQKKVSMESFQAFLGGKDTESPLHNAMASNLFIQVYGEKKWSLISPHYTCIIDPDPIRNVYRGAPFRLNNYPFNPFNPIFDKPYELFKYVDRYDIVLKPGDVFYNPPFWWHSVVNLSDSIGVGYRWLSRSHSFKMQPFYSFLDHLATKPPIWKGYKMLEKDVNLIHLSDGGRLKKYLKEKNELAT